MGAGTRKQGTAFRAISRLPGRASRSFSHSLSSDALAQPFPQREACTSQRSASFSSRENFLVACCFVICGVLDRLGRMPLFHFGSMGGKASAVDALLHVLVHEPRRACVFTSLNRHERHISRFSFSAQVCCSICREHAAIAMFPRELFS